MRANSASHLLRQPVSFELFLFSYLVCALILQKINIYKTNYYLVDFNLVLFTIVILSRRLGWCLLQELQSHWPTQKKSSKSSSKGGAFRKWILEGGINVKHVMVVLCTLLVIVWSVVRLIEQTSLFNLLFLFYPLLLYLSLFGFTLEPRVYRNRFAPPKTFLQHIDFTSAERQKLRSKLFPPHPMEDKSGVTTLTASSESPVLTESTTPPPNTCNAGPFSNHVSSKNASSNSPSNQASNLSALQGPTQRAGNRNNSHKEEKSETPQTSLIARLALGNFSGDRRYTWEYALMLPTTPEEVRMEVDILLSDLIVRLKQLLFNSLLCAYYVGFIPMLFADSHLFYNKWWCVEHAFLVWANSFVILSSVLLPPSYCQLLYQCALHLGCWTRCIHDQNTRTWAPHVIWQYDSVVQWNGESFKGEGVYNMAIPCDSSQEFFYLLFQSRLHVHTWLLTMQCITVLFQIVVLLRSIYWYQLLSMSVLLVFNAFVFYKLLYNRLWFRRTQWIIS